MKTDLNLRDDVMDELAFEPSIDETQIGVTTKNGVVTLNGHVSSYAQKGAAENAVRRVAGVKAIAEEIEVNFPSSIARTDAQIAEAAANAIQWNTFIPSGKVKIKVEDSWVYLDGEVDWQYQKDAAKNAINPLYGVRNVLNRISLKSRIHTKDVNAQIKKALERSARIDASKISVEANGHTVTLKGNVHSWAEKQDAKDAAYNVSGVWTVKNELEVV